MEGVSTLIPWRRVKGWACVHCGRCCSTYDIPVTFEDELRLRKFGSVFRKGKVGLYLKKKKGTCVFWRKGRCKIYDERPTACKLYPFYVKKWGKEEARFNGYYVYVDSKCGGINKGDLNNLLEWINYSVEIKTNRYDVSKNYQMFHDVKSPITKWKT